MNDSKEINLYRALWVKKNTYNEYIKNNKEILPRGIFSSSELNDIVKKTIIFFGSLKNAALYYITSPNPPDILKKCSFTFWSRDRSVAEIVLSNPSYDITDCFPIIINTKIIKSNNIIIAKDLGLYDEKIFNEFNLDGFSWEDEVMVAEPIYNYIIYEYKEIKLYGKIMWKKDY